MSTATRTALTAAGGVLLGLATLVAENQGFPTAGINGAIDGPLILVAVIGFFAVPVAVGRWWASLSMVGPALAFLVMQVADVQVKLDDTTGPAINYRTVLQFLLVSLVMLGVAAVRPIFVARQSDQPG